MEEDQCLDPKNGKCKRREAELEVCYCSVYFVLLLLLYVL